MLASVRWLNEYLDPANVTAQGAERALTDAGFPVESHTELPDGDVRLDVEVTSNRGDCLSHVGLAREIAAATGRRLRLPAVPGPADGAAPGAPPARSAVAVDNRVPDLCRLFTARVIRGVKVGPSPAWLVRALESVGQRSINNVVDVTNFVALEFGQPTHVFDLATLRRSPPASAHAPTHPQPLPTLTVRTARPGERVALLNGTTALLQPGDLVIADGDPPAGNGGPPGRVVSLAGIMGGAETEVSARTTDLVLEAATWDPASIRRTARRLGLRTEASHRFERLVDPRTIDPAARRAADLIVRVAGGTLLAGAVEAGADLPAARVIRLRARRCRDLLGMRDLSAPEMARVLRAHEIDAQVVHDAGAAPAAAADDRGDLVCTIPPHRPDLEREIDLVEEVARTVGFDRLPPSDTIAVRVTGEQREERALRDVAQTLAALGFFEAVTYTFVSPAAAAPFLPAGAARIDVCDQRRAAEPTLRPSLVPSLLAARRLNRDRGVDAEGGVRLFEVAAVFAQAAPASAGGAGGEAVERRTLALLADPPPMPGAGAHDRAQRTLRLLRGAIDAAARAAAGPGAPVRVEPGAGAAPAAAYQPGACAAVEIGGRRAGVMGLLARDVLRAYDLEGPIGAAELDLAALLAPGAPRGATPALPAFPAIERDLSLIVPEATPWARIESLVRAARPALLDESGEGAGVPAVRFVGVYRGPQAGEGRKSVTLRLRFRDPSRTLRHEEVDPQVRSLIDLSARELGAVVRTA